MATRDIIVLGASSGGLEAMNKVIRQLPVDLPAAVFIVWHMAPDSPGLLPEILSQAGTLPAFHPADFDRIQSGRIYVATPDHHLLVEPGRVRVTRGPKENRFRPAVDPLFRSAALAYGSRVVGVILSGNLDDGTAGLLAVKQRGGLAIVQDPREATYPSMPRSAMEKVEIDYCLPVAQIGETLARLVVEPGAEQGEIPVSERMKIETRIAGGDNALAAGILSLGDPSTFTCPDCHGVLMMLQDERVLRFRCHTGHAFSASTLLEAITESMEADLWSVLRIMDECMMLTRHLGEHLRDNGEPEKAEPFFQKSKENELRAKFVRRLILSHENLDEDSLRHGD